MWVAPLAGAWIETIQTTISLEHVKSHPSRVRGLKPVIGGAGGDEEGSHPSRVRGLKLASVDNDRQVAQSHPSRVRGLKPGLSAEERNAMRVAPLAGAWIETHA